MASFFNFLKRIVIAWLTITVHVDAFRSAPRAYLTAVKWWIRRRWVRARGQFAPLLNQSSNAYRLWALRQERRIIKPDALNSASLIIALVDLGVDYVGKDLAATLDSLSAEGIAFILIGSANESALETAIDQIDWSRKPWLFPLAPGDKIAYGAAAAYRAAMGDPAVRLIYADDDLRTGRTRHTPYFKPDWNAELFRYSDYISGSCLLHVTKADLQAMLGIADWVSQLTRQLTNAGKPLHLHQILHHRRQRPKPRLPLAPLTLARDLPTISVVVPTRNRLDLLRPCLEGLAATDYPDIEVIVVDNDSDDPDTLAYLAALDPARHRILRHAGVFNYSAINNRAVDVARGQLLCLLNNDVSMIDTHWLAIMGTQALRPDVGAVGARLLYPDGRLQHAGVVIGVGNAAGHAHRFLRPDQEGYFNRHSLPQFTTAVTAACLVVLRERFLTVGGLDEHNFAVAFNDVDLCLRLNHRGWQSLYEPRATLIHHESVSRGLDQDSVGAARFAGELAALQRIWNTSEVFDPYHHPQLSRSSEQFAMAL